ALGGGDVLGGVVGGVIKGLEGAHLGGVDGKQLGGEARGERLIQQLDGDGVGAAGGGGVHAIAGGVTGGEEVRVVADAGRGGAGGVGMARVPAGRQQAVVLGEAAPAQQAERRGAGLVGHDRLVHLGQVAA